MRTSNFNKPTYILALGAFLFGAAPALAQEESSGGNDLGISVSGNAAVTSDYRFRGVSFSDGDFAIQGGIDVEHDSGFYVGVWGSSIEDSAVFGHTELDLYGGWSGEVISGITVDVGMLYYYFPNGEDSVGASDYWEPYVEVTGALGPVEATVGVAYAWDQASLEDEDNLYLFTDMSAGIPDTPISVNAHLGYTDGVLSIDTDDTSFDWSVGAAYAITEKLSASVTYVGVQGPSSDGFSDDTVVFTLGVEF